MQPLVDAESAMSAGEEKGNGFHALHEVVVTNTIERVAEPRESPASKRPAGGSRWRSSSAGVAARAEPVRAMHPEFRTEVAVGDLTVTGVLPGAVRAPEGSVAISGDVDRLSCDLALELVDALLLVVTRMDVVAEERLTATIFTTRERED